ncbi:hypothetical protein [Stenotrophomonas sp. SY1]|uniref:hypothetical protein n=1 Tax=Stenotrophomonas sp. SY1 TaxID=477235 RepID=UPI001E31295B|nr:hypothetical protein [Stenotrophomonas sp. SY1]MCD9087426.1 hypothetical protein [Stenotrophomonas sp. SY1]
MKALRWGLGSLLAVLLLVAGVWAVSRLMPIPAAQQQALALLHHSAAEPAPGRNAFDGLWLLGLEEVSDAERAAILAEDIEQMQRLAERPIDVPLLPADVASVAQAPHGQVPQMQGLCGWRGGDCLARVRADPAAVEAALAGQQGLLARISALSGAGHYRNRFVADARLPMPNFILLQRSLPAHALAHVQGRSDAALAGICADVRTAKVLISHSDGLLPANVGAAMIGGNVQLLASVLAELPLDHPLPAACDGVFVAVEPQALSQCPAMRGEFAMVSRGVQVAPQRLQWLVWDKRKTDGLIALSMAGACSSRTAEAVQADVPPSWTSVPRSIWRLECAANAAGCMVASIAAPAYDRYGLALQDGGARLRLAEALLWLRANPQADASTALLQMPARLREGERPLLLGSDAASLQVASYYAKDNGAAFSVPLPGTASRR